MAERLRRQASGGRHLRWAREIQATIDAHIAHNDQLTAPQREVLTRESEGLGLLVAPLATAVPAYRGWLDGAHVTVRAELRVANYLADVAQQSVDGTLRPHRETLASVISGGLSTVFSRKPLSSVLRAGHARTAKYARDAALTLASVPALPGLPSLEPLVTRLDAVAERIEKLLERQDTVIEPERRPLKLAVERAVLGLREGLEQMDGRLRGAFPARFIESLYPELSKGSTAVADEDDEDDDDSGPPVTDG